MTDSVRIAKGLRWDPSETATQTFGVIARKGGGKTYAAGKVVEELHAAGCPVVVFDPVGNWGPGLRRSASGKGPGLEIAVLGGDHGDLELEERDAVPVAEYLAEKNASAVLDLSRFRKAERKRFVAEFAEAFFHVCKRHRAVRMVVFEEAQVFAPQRSQGQERMLGAIEDIVRLGRNYGIGSMLLSQRPQSVNKEVLNQVECLLVGQLSGAHERKAIREWVVTKGEDLDEQLRELPSLKVGEFFCWSPQWLGIFERVKILKKRTWDASSTPKLGEELEAGKLAQVDVGELQEALRPPEKATGPTERPESSNESSGLQLALVQAQSDRDDWKRRAEQWEQAVGVWKARMLAVETKVGELAEFCAEPPAGVIPERSPELDAALERGRRDAEAFQLPAAPGRYRSNGAPAQGSQKLGKAERAVLTVLLQHRKAMPKAQLAMMAGYSAKGGGFGNALSRLRQLGLLEGSGELGALPAAAEALGPFEALPRGRELFTWWVGRLGKAERAVLVALSHGAMSREELGAAAGYEPRGGGFGNALSRLRTLGLIEGSGTLDLSEDFRQAIR